MYKLKTNHSVSKRFKTTCNGKILKRKSCKSHLLQKKSSKRKRQLSKVSIVSSYDKVSILSNLPYLK